MKSIHRLQSAAVALMCHAALVNSSEAVVLWSDDFSDDTVGSAPSRDFTGNSVQDYVFVAGLNLVAAVGNPGNSLSRIDTSTSNASDNASVLMGQFTPFTLGAGQQIKTTYDYRVDSYLSGTVNQSPRFLFRYANASGQQMMIGLGRTATNIDGDPAANDLTLYAHVATTTDSLVTPTAANAIGLSAGAWAPGFDFGDYSATADDNDTNDQFYRIVFTYDYDTGAVVGSATNQTTAETITFSRTMTANLAFSNTVASNSIFFAGSSTATSTDYFDNVMVELIPEPSAALLLGGAALLTAFRRTKRAER